MTTTRITKFRLRYLTTISLVVCMASVALGVEPVKEFSGRWKGSVETPGTPLAVDINLRHSADAWSGDISIPAQGATDIELGHVAIEGKNVSFTIKGIPGDPTFKGSLSEDGQQIAGDYSQAGATFPFWIKRADRLATAARENLEDFAAFANQALVDWNTPGLAIGVVADGEVVYAQGFGHRNVEQRLPVTARTLFAIGSSSKAFTTFALGTLVDEGKLDWDKPVINYLPEFRLFDEYATQHITPRDLVTHRSGLPRHDLAWYNSPASRTELVGRLQYLPPNKDLRETFQYNNLMFMTAGYLAGRLTGTTWEMTVRTRIFEPLDMRYSNFSVHESQKTQDFALPYEEKDDEIRRMAFRDIDNVGPAGSINSNIEDMTKWLICQLGKGKFNEQQVIQDTTLADMHTPHMAISRLPTDKVVTPGNYGLGWMIDSYRGHLRVHHGGAIDGFRAMVTLYPRDGLGVVAFCNSNGTPLQNIATRRAVDRVLGYDDDDWYAEAMTRRDKGKEEQEEAEEKKDVVRKTGTSPAHPLEEYVGEYEHPGYGVVKIEAAEKALTMTYNNIPTPLKHWHYETFNGQENPDDRAFEDFKIRFLTNMKGNVDALSAPFETLLGETTFKKKPDRRMFDAKYLARFEGGYELGEQTVTVAIKGNTLTLSVPGQPTYELEPDREDEFNLKGLSGFSVKFMKSEGGSLMARFNQPNGVFDAKRKEP